MGFGRSDSGRSSQINRFSECSREDFSQWFNGQEDGSSCLACSKLMISFHIYNPLLLRKIGENIME